MTIERPMFPPVADECRVIQFASFAAAAKLAKEVRPDASTSYRDDRIAKRKARLLELTTAPETLSETCKNSRLRLSRRDAWWEAAHLTDYCRARLDWHSSLSTAQSRNIADANSYPKADDTGDNCWTLVALWRDALVKRMLTPAPDALAVAWKRAQLRAENYKYTDVKPERIERSIAEDVAFLAAHPTRRLRPAVQS